MSARSDITVRTATVADVVDICELDRLGRLGRWSPEMYKAFMDDPGAGVRVAQLGAKVVGFYAISKTYPEMELLKIAVRPEIQGTGVGQALLDDVLSIAGVHGFEACFLEVRSSNSRAIRFYDKKGFQVIGLRRAYYREPIEDALVMRKELRRTG